MIVFAIFFTKMEILVIILLYVNVISEASFENNKEIRNVLNCINNK